MDKSAIRLQLRHRRRALTAQQQQQAARLLSQRLLSNPLIIKAQRIALYWPSDGEISALPLLEALRKQGKQCYLPVIFAAHKMRFAPFINNLQLKNNHYGIPEPYRQGLLDAKHLDVILMPLVGFDGCGQRLGMGGGYYDRALAFKLRQSWRRRPHLIGLAHAFQQLDALPVQSWDVPMSAVFTDTAFMQMT